MRGRKKPITRELITVVKDDLERMSGMDVARKHNISKSTVSNIKTGKYDFQPTSRTDTIWNSLLTSQKLGSELCTR